jgi:hypothetical protein
MQDNAVRCRCLEVTCFRAGYDLEDSGNLTALPCIELKSAEYCSNYS